MAGNITVKEGTTVLGVINLSGSIPGLAYGLSNRNILYKYANLTLPYSPNDPGLSYTYPNTNGLSSVLLDVAFFNLLNEPSTMVRVNVGSTGVSGGAQDCLNPLDFGAVGDGVTNDTAAVQCCLDQAAKNWNIMQSAIAQGRTITPGPTKVCIPSGFTFLVGDSYWFTGACAATWWGPNGNWPTNTNLFLFSATYGFITADLFVRSGVQIQLDGNILKKRVDPVPLGHGADVMIAIVDDNVADGHASNVSIIGSGRLDDNSAGLNSGFGGCIYALISHDFLLDGPTIANSPTYAMRLYNNEVPNVTVFGNYFPTQKTVYQDSTNSNITIRNCVFNSTGTTTNATTGITTGIIDFCGTGISIHNNLFQDCIGTFGLSFSGKNILIQDNRFNNCGSICICVGCVDDCVIKGNQIPNGGGDIIHGQMGSAGAISVQSNKTALKLMGPYDYLNIPPQYPIDYHYGLQITDNYVNKFNGLGIFVVGFEGQPIGQGFYSNFDFSNNTLTNCSNLGFYYQSISAGNCPPCGANGDGSNWGITIGGNKTFGNGLGTKDHPTTARPFGIPSWPATQDFFYNGQYFGATALNGTLYLFNGIPCPALGSASFITKPYPFPNMDLSRQLLAGIDLAVYAVIGRTDQMFAPLTFAETPQGVVDGSNKVFTLTAAPNPTTTLIVYKDGAQTTQYSLNGKQITFAVAPTQSVFVTYSALNTIS